MQLDEVDVGVIGLGYVGLPLAVEFGKFRNVVGFDTNRARINALRGGNDSTLEVSAEQLREAKGLSFSDDIKDIKQMAKSCKHLFKV